MTASIPAYVAYINELRAQQSPKILRILERYEATEDYDSPEYEKTLFTHVYRQP